MIIFSFNFDWLLVSFPSLPDTMALKTCSEYPTVRYTEEEGIFRQPLLMKLVKAAVFPASWCLADESVGEDMRQLVDNLVDNL